MFFFFFPPSQQPGPDRERCVQVAEESDMKLRDRCGSSPVQSAARLLQSCWSQSGLLALAEDARALARARRGAGKVLQRAPSTDRTTCMLHRLICEEVCVRLLCPKSRMHKLEIIFVHEMMAVLIPPEYLILFQQCHVFNRASVTFVKHYIFSSNPPKQIIY